MKNIKIKVKGKIPDIQCGSEFVAPEHVKPGLFPYIISVQMPVDTGFIQVGIQNLFPVKVIGKIEGVQHFTTGYMGDPTPYNQGILDNFLISKGLPTETIQDNTFGSQWYISKQTAVPQVVTLEFYYPDTAPSDFQGNIACPDPNIIPP